MFKASPSFTRVQYDRRKEQGHTILSAYYDANIATFSTNVEIEFSIPRYVLSGVPVTGKIDKIEFDGEDCTVVDYKTGDPDKSASAITNPPSENEPNGGDYWRQMVFYKLLIENFKDKNWKVMMGVFDFIQPSKTGDFKRVQVPVFHTDEAIVLAQLTDTYHRIMAHEFDQGCGKDTCHWCNFAKRYELITVESDDRGEDR